MTVANAHALFNGLKADPSYLANLTIDPGEKQTLLKAQADIRACLKAAVARLKTDDEFWQSDYIKSRPAYNRPELTIRFMTQGSFAYGTLNAPAKIGQEIDLDDGMYIPVDFLSGTSPALSAKGAFKFVEEALAPLCTQRNWALDKSKDTCVRVKLWAGAHIDIPIYSIPRDQFVQIVEAANDSAGLSLRKSIMDSYQLPTDKVMLALRDGTWQQSDPKKLHDWVKGRKDRYGAIYIRLCRFFKGWRDHFWPKSKLSSICIMRAIDLALAKLPGFPVDNRDDEMALEVAKHLPEVFAANIDNPVLKSSCLNEWADEDRNVIIQGSRAIKAHLESALELSENAANVVIQLQNGFGTRVPNRPDAVKLSPTRIETIRSVPPEVKSAPRVISSTSG